MARRSIEAVRVASADRAALIAEHAYFKAELRGFAPGGELDDWLAAEREISAAESTEAKPRPRRKNGAATKA